MPWLVHKEDNQFCVFKENPDGSAGEKVACHATEAEADEQRKALYASMEADAYKYRLMLTGAVKVAGDWRLDITGIPFGSRDSDGQWFDENTDVMHKAFSTPLLLYQHGVKRGGKGLQDRPLVIGNSLPGTLEKKSDGWHVIGELDSTKPEAVAVMDAAHKMNVAVSSDSISHLARLEVGGKLVQYEKKKPGRIAVWPWAGTSLWEMGNGNHRPANRMAMALPAMKAMYRDAGIPFPDRIASDTNGGVAYADEAARRAKILASQERSKQLLKKLGETK